MASTDLVNVFLYAMMMGMLSQTLPMLSYLSRRKPYKLWSYLGGLLALLVVTLRALYPMVNGFDDTWSKIDVALDFVFLPVRIIIFRLAAMRCIAFTNPPRWTQPALDVWLAISIIFRVADRSINAYQLQPLSKAQNTTLNYQKKVLKQTNVHMLIWPLFFMNITLVIAVIRHVLRMNGHKGVLRALRRVADVLMSLFFEIVALIYLLVWTINDFAPIEGNYIKLAGPTDLVVVIILCNLIRFGISVTELLGGNKGPSSGEVGLSSLSTRNQSVAKGVNPVHSVPAV
ncbi:hypothetical protein HK104_001949 [Borealophlyctis nickersoniae]|nr:hypothetical protein HK104_001949 [Borealophlyctis nickersoniae]